MKTPITTREVGPILEFTTILKVHVVQKRWKKKPRERKS